MYYRYTLFIINNNQNKLLHETAHNKQMTQTHTTLGEDLSLTVAALRSFFSFKALAKGLSSSLSESLLPALANSWLYLLLLKAGFRMW